MSRAKSRAGCGQEAPGPGPSQAAALAPSPPVASTKGLSQTKQGPSGHENPPSPWQSTRGWGQLWQGEPPQGPLRPGLSPPLAQQTLGWCRLCLAILMGRHSDPQAGSDRCLLCPLSTQVVANSPAKLVPSMVCTGRPCMHVCVCARCGGVHLPHASMCALAKGLHRCPGCGCVGVSSCRAAGRCLFLWWPGHPSQFSAPAAWEAGWLGGGAELSVLGPCEPEDLCTPAGHPQRDCTPVCWPKSLMGAGRSLTQLAWRTKLGQRPGPVGQLSRGAFVEEPCSAPCRCCCQPFRGDALDSACSAACYMAWLLSPHLACCFVSASLSGMVGDLSTQRTPANPRRQLQLGQSPKGQTKINPSTLGG